MPYVFNPPAPTFEDVKERFEELPLPVQKSIVSLSWSLKRNYRLTYTEYPRTHAEFIKDSGLIDVQFSEFNRYGVQFKRNTRTQIIIDHAEYFVGCLFK